MGLSILSDSWVDGAQYPICLVGRLGSVSYLTGG